MSEHKGRFFGLWTETIIWHSLVLFFSVSASQLDSACLIWIQECSADDTKAAEYWQDETAFAYDVLDVGHNSSRCLDRAEYWYTYCKNSPSFPVRALFVPTDDFREFPRITNTVFSTPEPSTSKDPDSSKVFSTGSDAVPMERPVEHFLESIASCMVLIQECTADPSMAAESWQADTTFAFDHLGVGDNAANCLNRAEDWHTYCRNPPSALVRAFFDPTDEYVEYPSDDRRSHHPAIQDAQSCSARAPPEHCRPAAPDRRPTRPTSDAAPTVSHGAAQQALPGTHGGSTQAQAPAAAPAAPARLSVALLITGQLYRFAFNTTAARAVLPHVRAGHAVAVFVFLARTDCGGQHNMVMASNARTYSPAEESRVRDWFKLQVEAHGGRLAGFEISDHWDIVTGIGPYRFSQWEGADLSARLQQYVGWYRVWKAVEIYEVAQRLHFDFIILQRSDGMWVGEMAAAHVFSREAVSVKDCMHWMGINDKVFVIPRELASTWLEVIVAIYIDISSTRAFYSNEHLLYKYAKAKGIRVEARPISDLPVLDIRHFNIEIGTEEVRMRGGCFNELYLGPNLECVPPTAVAAVRAAACKG